MRLRVIDGVLVLVSIAGALLFMRERRDLADLERELARVHSLVGDMVVEDRSVCHVQAIATGDPWQWAWRVYLPKSSRGKLDHKSGGGSGSHGFSTDEQMAIARCSITSTRSGTVGIYFSFVGGSSYSSFGTPEFLDFLKENRDQLQLVQIGSDGPQQIKVEEPPLTLFRLSMSEQLAQEARERFPDPNLQWMIPNLTEVTLDLQ